MARFVRLNNQHTVNADEVEWLEMVTDPEDEGKILRIHMRGGRVFTLGEYPVPGLDVDAVRNEIEGSVRTVTSDNIRGLFTGDELRELCEALKAGERGTIT